MANLTPHAVQHDLKRWFLRLAVAMTLVSIAVAGLWTIPRISKGLRISRAVKLLRNHQHSAAKELLQSLQNEFPQDPEVLLRLARAYRRLGEFENMTTTLRAAVRCNAPTRAIDLEATLAKAQVGHMSEVGRRLSKLLQDPGDDGPDICEAYVNGYFLINKVDSAFRIIEAWKADFPQDAQPHLFEGLYFEQLGRSSKSVPALRHALELAPSRSDIRIRLAKQLFDIQSVEQAEAEARIVLRTEPLNPSAGVILAKCLNVAGQPREAIERLEQVISASPQSVDAVATLGQILVETQEYGAAIRSLRRAVELKPFESSLRYSLGNALVAAGMSEEAKRHFQIVSEAKQQLATINQLKDTLSKSADSADVRYEIGWRLLKYDDPLQGEMWLRSALEIAPDHEKSRMALVEYYRSTGKTDLVKLYSENRKRRDDGN